jgi:hypothetical protein
VESSPHIGEDDDPRGSEPLLDSLLDEDEPEEPKSDSSRLFRVAASLLQVHVQIAREELARDEGRVFRGLMVIAVSALLGAAVLGLLQVLGVLVVHARGFSWPLAILVTAGADTVLGLLFLFLGMRSLRRPVMPKTRAQIRRTVNAILSS